METSDVTRDYAKSGENTYTKTNCVTLNKDRTNVITRDHITTGSGNGDFKTDHVTIEDKTGDITWEHMTTYN